MAMTEPEARAARLDVLEFVRTKLSAENLDIAKSALLAIERDHGCNTPAEEFFTQIINRLDHGLTPDDVQTALLGFEENFEDVRKNCQYAHRFYPTLAAKAAQEVLEEEFEAR